MHLTIHRPVLGYANGGLDAARNPYAYMIVKELHLSKQYDASKPPNFAHRSNHSFPSLSKGGDVWHFSQSSSARNVSRKSSSLNTRTVSLDACSGVNAYEDLANCAPFVLIQQVVVIFVYDAAVHKRRCESWAVIPTFDCQHGEQLVTQLGLERSCVESIKQPTSTVRGER